MREAKLFQNLSRLLKPGAQETPLSSPEAFSELYERSHLSVYRYIYGLHGGEPQDVEDLTAETFTRAWKARHSFSGDPQMATGWLLRIARRLVIDGYRRSRTHIQPEAAQIDELPHGDPTPEDKLLAGEQQKLLADLLRQLPEEQREMLTLRYFLDWRVNQIGEYLGIPENTVSVAIRRALARLQQNWPRPKEYEK